MNEIHEINSLNRIYQKKLEQNYHNNKKQQIIFSKKVVINQNIFYVMIFLNIRGESLVAHCSTLFQTIDIQKSRRNFQVS